VRTIFVALGFTVLYLFFLIKPILEPSQHYFYHWSGSASNFFLPVAINFLGVWLLIFLLLLFARKPGRARVAIWSALLLLTSCVYTHLNILYQRFPSVNLGSVAFVVAVAITLVLTLLWRPRLNHRYELVLAKATTILIFLGLFGALMLFNLGRYAWEAHRSNERASLQHAPMSETPQPHRIIWIVFDELSQDQVYDHRFPGLQLPAFDSLAQQSTVFTAAVPPDINTEVVLPALIMGKPFDNIKKSAGGLPRLLNASSGKWQTFDEYDSAFEDALHAGYSTAVAGWYNPYCRILPDVLHQCSWTYSYPDGNATFAFETTMSNTLRITRSLEIPITSLLPSGPAKYVAGLIPAPPELQTADVHLRDYRDVNAASLRLLRNRSLGFVFLHLPIPHPVSIYSRNTGDVATPSSSYIDNLALTDKCLAGIRATLEEAGEWDSATVVVMGDHSWRVPQIWRKRTSEWTAEDEAASSGGQYDPRPAYIVKLAGQTTGSRFTAPFQTIDTRRLLDAVMAHQITTPAQLSTWAQTAH
jgi:hypothetical protein